MKSPAASSWRTRGGAKAYEARSALDTDAVTFNAAYSWSD